MCKQKRTQIPFWRQLSNYYNNNQSIYISLAYFNYNTIQKFMKTVNVKSLGECPYLVSLQPQDLIGKGSYASVRRAYNRDGNSERLAAKTFDLSDSKKFESAIKQLVVVSKIPKHPNLVEYKKIKITSKNKLYIIMELCSQSLEQKLAQSTSGLSEKQIWSFIFQFCEGYKILQQKSIVHRDIKPDNILIGFDGKYKISDFGLSDIIQQIQKTSKKTKGSLPFMAPEVLLRQDYGQQQGAMSDVYSFGVTIYYCCFRQFPYFQSKKQKDKWSIYDFLKQLKNNSLTLSKANSYSESLLSLISSCLEKSPQKRCKWEFLYYSLYENLSKRARDIKQKQDTLIQSKNKNFRIIQISDTFLKNLSALDTDLYCSLSHQSVILIDHVQANIISQRQTIFYCDRLYYRITIIHDRLSSKQPQDANLSCLQDFCKHLLAFNYLKCKQLDREFEQYYKVIDKNQYIKCLTSKKYSCLRNLIGQDLSFLLETVREAIPDILEQPLKIDQCKVKIYESFSNIILFLYRNSFYEQCKQIDELQKFIEQNQDCLLRRLRKNQNALAQFDQSIRSLTKKKLKQIISKQYLHYFRNIDNQQ